MKKQFIIYILLFVVGMTSCEDFLNKELQGYPEKDTYYQTTYQLQEALNAAYDVLQLNQFMRTEWIFGEACADDIVGNNETSTDEISQIVNFNFSPSNTYIKERYEINYRGINRANQVIANIHRVKFANTDYSNYTTVREIFAQAKFLRAFYYFNLVKTFGGVPIRPEEEDINNLVIPRSSKEEVYAYIEKDLREAAIMLRTKFTDANAGKVGSGACVALLMKVLMYQATPGVASEKWEEIVKLGSYFIQGTPLTYRELIHFDENYDQSWDELREYLFWKPKALLESTDPYEDVDTQMASLANEYSLESKSTYDGSTLHYRDLYHQIGEFCSRSVFEVVFKESANGLGGDENEGSSIWHNIFYVRMFASASFRSAVQGDPRESEVILAHAGATFDGQRLEVPPGRYGCMKWYTAKVDRSQDYTDADGSEDDGKNRRVIIYSEVILMYAEALNEIGERERALAQLNSVKAIANKITNVSTLYKPGTYMEMRDQIWTERRIELCHLWDRFFDIVRQGRAADILHAFATETTHSRGTLFREGINEIFPIPQTEVDVTNGIVNQNPGY